MKDRVMLLLYEWKHIFRQPTVWSLFFLFFVIGGYAIYSGNALTNKKLKAIDEAKKESVKDYHNTLKAFNDTLTIEKKKQAENAGNPYVIDYRYPRIAFDYPYPLTGLAAGIKDVTPVTEKVNYYTDYAAIDREITNPAILFDGRLDLVYVNLYLIPLLIIVLVYNILSSEKENGISRLLIVQGGTIKRVLLIKLTFRLGLVFLAAVFLNALGMLLSPSGYPSVWNVFLWFFLLLSYCIFWFSLCFIIISLDRNSVFNLFSCLALWIFLLFLLPLVINKTAQLRNPSELKLLDLQDKDRLISDEVWAMNPKSVTDSFYRNYPQYKSAYTPADTLDNQNDAFFAGYYQIKQNRMKAVVDSLWKNENMANQTAHSLIKYNPVQNTEYLFTLLAHTSRKDYLQYKQDVKDFQRIWQNCFYNRVFSMEKGKRKLSSFSLEELKEIPEFKVKYHEVDLSEFTYGIWSLWLISIIFCAGGLFLIKKIKQ
ncbi:ABC-type transport system involved in multi-copper enzyme maturation, permease component [Elizabethkingia miricola]|nr:MULTISPECIES: ABC transporter permease [Elizabethkingia]MCL1652695.1 ABC transporter permease [Elizabethkingia miricola]QCO48098.1 ABC transporter permease [Elizabethkingia sp. 2-6]WQM39144.1 ABC transporter permease [Elizabethkingia miricola]SPW32852.1 ABC-type transport system involved in multi-copper enzyme maturation, permease component [Elizabethkingia miricola]